MLDVEELRLKDEKRIMPKPAFMEETLEEKELRRTREIFGNAITNSSIHGIAGIYAVESKILKLIMTVLFIVSAGFCGYQLYIGVINFMSFSVFTTTSLEYEIPAEFSSTNILVF
jgi:hypothetical protein